MFKYRISKSAALARACGISLLAGAIVCAPDPIFPRERPPGFVTQWNAHQVGPYIAAGSNSHLFVMHYDTPSRSHISEHSMMKFKSDGKFVRQWGSRGSRLGEFEEIAGIATDSHGNVYVGDRYNYRVQKYTGDGSFLTSWGRKGTDAGDFDRVMHDVAVGPDGNVFVLHGLGPFVLQEFTSKGRFVTKHEFAEGRGQGQFLSPRSLAIGRDGSFYISDVSTHRVQRFSDDAVLLDTWGKGGLADGEFRDVGRMAIDAASNVYVIDMGNNRIQKFTSDGTYLTKWGRKGQNPGEFDRPNGLAIDAKGYIYVIDSPMYEEDRIQVFGYRSE